MSIIKWLKLRSLEDLLHYVPRSIWLYVFKKFKLFKCIAFLKLHLLACDRQKFCFIDHVSLQNEYPLSVNLSIECQISGTTFHAEEKSSVVSSQC